MSKVSRYPSTPPDPAATRRADRAMIASFLGARQNGVLGGGPPEAPVGGVPADGVPPEGGPTTGGRLPADPPEKEAPGLDGLSGAEFQDLLSPVLKDPLAAGFAA